MKSIKLVDAGSIIGKRCVKMPSLIMAIGEFVVLDYDSLAMNLFTFTKTVKKILFFPPEISVCLVPEFYKHTYTKNLNIGILSGSSSAFF